MELKGQSYLTRLRHHNEVLTQKEGIQDENEKLVGGTSKTLFLRHLTLVQRDRREGEKMVFEEPEQKSHLQGASDSLYAHSVIIN